MDILVQQICRKCLRMLREGVVPRNLAFTG